LEALICVQQCAKRVFDTQKATLEDKVVRAIKGEDAFRMQSWITGEMNPTLVL
jgi:hypothetical protein